MKDNMKNIKKALISAIAIVGLTTSAFAFEGFSVGASYSSADYSTSGTESTAAAEATVATSTAVTKTGSADIGSVFAEYTFSQGSTIGLDYIDGSATLGKASRTSASRDIFSSLAIYVPLMNCWASVMMRQNDCGLGYREILYSYA